ncbi:MAG TPA: VWA domain-containing protein, partial [Polyangiales bacterium]|nr:VWA domain-containing protein [Polyangiales bacterium]
MTPPPASDSAAGSAAPAPQRPAQSGTLTAGTWDDNRNFDRFMQYRANQQRLGRAGILPIIDAEHNEAHETFAEIHGPRETLDVALVIDTTGSMSDEIRYLQTEFLALSR